MAWFNKRTYVDLLDRTFDSRAEAERAVELAALVRAGKIHSLDFQPRFDFVVEGVRVGRYTADFSYWDVERGRAVVEDVKPKNGHRTEAYKIRKRLLMACHGVEVEEVAR